MKIFKYFFVLWIFCGEAMGEMPSNVFVSFYETLANPQKFDSRQITLGGYVFFSEENECLLVPTQFECVQNMRGNAIQLPIESEKKIPFFRDENTPVWVTGVFCVPHQPGLALGVFSYDAPFKINQEAPDFPMTFPEQDRRIPKPSDIPKLGYFGYTTPLVQIFMNPGFFYEQELAVRGFLRKDFENVLRLVCSRNDGDAGFGEVLLLDFDELESSRSEILAQWTKWEHQEVYIRGILQATSVNEPPRLVVSRIVSHRERPYADSRTKFSSEAFFRGEKQDSPYLVSVERLLGNPMLFHDRVIRVQGYMIAEPEHFRLYSSPDCEKGCNIPLTASALGINFSNTEIQAQFSRHFVTLEGVFQARNSTICHISILGITVHTPNEKSPNIKGNMEIPRSEIPL